MVISEQVEDLIGGLRALKGCHATATAVQTRDVVQRALDSHGEARCLVLFLTERDNIAELRMVLSRTQGACLLVAPTSPPRASLARVANQHGAGLCSRHDPAVVRDVMLVALAALRSERAVS